METTGLPLSGKHQPAKPRAGFLRPPKQLSGHVYGALVRDTRGCCLPSSDRFNHFSASPLCALSWLFEGEAFIHDDHDGRHSVASISVSGPQSRPLTSWNPGPVCAMTVALFPDAFYRLTGIRVADIRDRTLPAHKLFDDARMKLLDRVMDAGSPETGFGTLMDHMARERQAASTGSGKIASLSDWSRSLAIRLANSGSGRSIRQMERRFRAWTGHTRRDLQHHVRMEIAFHAAMEAAGEGNLDASWIAHENGFADQSHMGRNVRRHTGHSPVDLMRKIETEESFWSYRVISGIGRTA